MKKYISMILAVICVLSVLAAAGCGSKKQEQSQAQFMKALQDMSLLCSPASPLPEDEGVYSMERISDEIIFLPGLYELYCHAYTLFDGSKEIASVDEVRSLFAEFDEETYGRFKALSDWYLLLNGNMYMMTYNDATAVARDLYNEKYGEDIMSGNWTTWSLEDRIALERFIRDNPDFMPAEQYEKELRYMGIVSP